MEGWDIRFALFFNIMLEAPLFPYVVRAQTNPQNKALLKILLVVHMSVHSLPRLQNPATPLYPEPDQSNPRPQTVPLKSVLCITLFFHLRLDLANCLSLIQVH